MTTLLRRLFSWLVRWLPSDFGGDFGESMRGDAAAFADRSAGFWIAEIVGLLAAIVREHFDVLRQDMKYAFRLMRRTPGFTLMAIVMLALGTGVNVAMFSVIDAVMLRSPFVDAGQLAMLRGVGADGALTPLRMDRLPEIASAPAIAAVGVIGGGSHVLTAAEGPVNLDTMSCVSSSMFDVLKTPPLIGRTFGADDDRPGATPTVVLAYTFWQTLGGSPAVLGQTLSINHTAVTVIGVMPRGYYGALARPNTTGWMPYHRPVSDANNSGCKPRVTETLIARLRPGLTRETASAATPGLRFEVLESVWMDEFRTPLKVLAAAVVCVLLIACLNVGGLQMERTLARRRELSLRLALGAGRSRVARQILTENLVFAAVGAAAGLGTTALSVRALIALLPPNLPYMDEIAVNARVLIAAIAIACAAGLVSGLFPLLETRRFTAGDGIASASGRATERRSSWTRRSLIVGQIALSLVVLIGAGLMIRTFHTLNPADPGFDPDLKLWQPARLRGATPEANASFYASVFDRLRSAPNITEAAGTTYVPLLGSSGDSWITIDGRRVRPLTNSITPNYFAVMKIPIVAGRAFSDADSAGSAPVVIVNEVLARRLEASGNVVGRRLVMDLTEAGVPGPPAERTIVGVTANTRGSGGDLRPRIEAYLPHSQSTGNSLTLIIGYRPGASAEAAAAVRRILLDVQPNFVVTPPRNLRTLVDEPVASLLFGARILGLFAGLAILLAAVGLMTTISWWVAQRTRELGVRMALGATRGQVARLVARQGLTLAACGVAAGCGAAAGVTRYMSSWIYGVTPLDTATFAVGAVVMFAIALIAIFFPTRRATQVDPVTALRAE